MWDLAQLLIKSKTGKVRVVAMFYRRQKRAHPKKITCDTCGQIFSSMSCLNRHKKSEKHDTRSLSKQTKKKPKDEKQNREHTNLTKFYIRWKVKKVTKKKMRNMLLSIISLLESVVIEWVSCESWISCASDITQSAFPRYLTRHLNN